MKLTPTILLFLFMLSLYSDDIMMIVVSIRRIHTLGVGHS